MIDQFYPILTALTSGGLYSLVWYVNKVVDPTNPLTVKDIDWTAILATAITGAIIGIVSLYYGFDLTQSSIETQMLSYAALTAVISRILKTGYRVISVKYPELLG